MLQTKYGPMEVEGVQKVFMRLVNQLWKLIPMREKEEEWEKQLESVILEIVGLKEIFTPNEKFLQLLSKLEGLKAMDTDFMLYRKTVFESISLLQEISYAFR